MAKDEDQVHRRRGRQSRAPIRRSWKSSGSSLEDFAAYCFNKSHAACYGLIAYQTAYLKAHFPAAFMAALLTSTSATPTASPSRWPNAQRMGINVLPPDVNESFLEFAVVKETGKIRFGLSAVKNVGTGAIEAITGRARRGRAVHEH